MPKSRRVEDVPPEPAFDQHRLAEVEHQSREGSAAAHPHSERPPLDPDAEPDERPSVAEPDQPRVSDHVTNDHDESGRLRRARVSVPRALGRRNAVQEM